jgi:hypothetical protein
MNKTFCDRCDREIEGNGIYHQFTIGHVLIEGHLCSICLNEIQVWLKTPRAEVKPK